MSLHRTQLPLSLSSLFLGALAALTAAPASAQTCTFIGSGPDVIVGDITTPANYAVVGSMDACALGTTSCNIGTAVLNFVDGTLNHPLISCGVYRYTTVAGAGRFEQLGQSWLKHAFAAAQSTTCCTNCTPADSQHLGVGCADPYGGALNGSQARLGPKYQVDPHVGSYIVAHPVPSGGNNGRIQMELADLSPSSASVRYFGESMYLALDDAQGNRNDNNTSWRELTVTAAAATAGYTFGVTSTTQRQQTALEAWKLIDPQVSISHVSTPEGTVAPYDGTGRVVLASRATSLGGGQWHYEYALHNMNSARAIGSFSVPIPPGVTVSNVGFRDVAYLGGDGVGGVDQVGTDWTVSSGSSLTWATVPFATDPNSNALRFATTYNFRFDADLGPIAGVVTLGQYTVVNNVVVGGVQVPGIPPAFQSICANDTLGADHTNACPCGNSGASGNGCAHSANALGARLTGYGSAAADTVQLDALGLPSAAFTLFMQHDAADDQVFHDGVLCAGGTLVRLRGRNAAGGASLFPDPTYPSDATLTLSQRGGVTVGSGVRRYYAAFFRNASTTFCPPATANVTNGWMLDW